MTNLIARASMLPAWLRQAFMALALAAGLLGLGTIGAQAQSAGQRFLVHWSGDQYSYPATIVEVRGERYSVRFDDGDQEWTTRDRIFPDDLRAGSRVFANWQGRGVYYPGQITRRNGNAIHISYDDGDQEDTTIGAVRVIR